MLRQADPEAKARKADVITSPGTSGSRPAAGSAPCAHSGPGSSVWSLPTSLAIAEPLYEQGGDWRGAGLPGVVCGKRKETVEAASPQL